VASDHNDEAVAPEVLAEIEAVVDQARRGDKSSLPRLRELLDEYPDLWRHCGDLAAHAQAAWANLATGTNLYMRETVAWKTEAMRKELAGPSPSPLERLLVERVVVCWVQLHYLEMIEAHSRSQGESPALTVYRGRRQALAQRGYLSAVAALATVRRLLSPTTPAARQPAPGPAASTGTQSDRPCGQAAPQERRSRGPRPAGTGHGQRRRGSGRRQQRHAVGVGG
jgi:hypothetical protein